MTNFLNDSKEKNTKATSLNEQVELYKQTLYKKIDTCFIKYGLSGLKIIDERIASGMSRYINSKNSKNTVCDHHSKVSLHKEQETPDLNEEMDDDIMKAASIIDELPKEENVDGKKFQMESKNETKTESTENNEEKDIMNIAGSILD